MIPPVDLTAAPARRATAPRRNGNGAPKPASATDTHRSLPQNVEAEKGLLGSILLAPREVLNECAEQLTEEAFYSPAHGTIYRILIEMWSANTQIDVITLTNRLRDLNLLDSVGGPGAVTELFGYVPTAANAPHYLDIVLEKSLLRRMITACTGSAARCYEEQGDVPQLLDDVEREIFTIGETRFRKSAPDMRDEVFTALENIEKMYQQRGRISGLATGFNVFDQMTDGLHPGEMMIVAARPSMGKTALAMNIVEHVALNLEEPKPVGVFSLEMSTQQLVQRMLCSRARVNMKKIRSGMLARAEHGKLNDAAAALSESKIFIDDTPSLTILELRAKGRRMRDRHRIELIAIDYLQLCRSTSRRGQENRQIEISEISAGIKALAKELEIPIIVLAQLNRQPEQRGGGKPRMSDLRESGCLTAATKIIRADTGCEVTMGEIFQTGARNVPVWSLNESLHYVPRVLTHVFATGRREVFRVRTASGRLLEATSNHPLLTLDGWCAVRDLAEGSRIAIPRHLPPPTSAALAQTSPERVAILAHMIGDGSMLPRQPVRYASKDEANIAFMTCTAPRAFQVSVHRDEYDVARCTTLRFTSLRRVTHGVRNPINEWLDQMGLFGRRSHEKFVPKEIFGLPNKLVALFLHHLWSTDGSISIHRNRRGGRIYYATTSRRLADDVVRLLLRFGIHSRIRLAKKCGYRDSYHVDVSGAASQKTFLQRIGCHGERGETGRQLMEILERVSENPNRDTVPREIWTRVRDILMEKDISHREFAAAMGTKFCGSTLWKHSPSRQRLAKVAAVLDDADLEMVASNDVYWDEIAEITSIGTQDVFDATVPGTHNFIADGVAVHNSLEQDADLVALLVRPEVYEEDEDAKSDLAGKAELIIAKQRNGPIGEIPLTFIKEYTRFENAAFERPPGGEE